MTTFPAALEYNALTGLVLPVVVITLSMSIPIVAIVTEHLQKQARMRLIAKAIEHGADLEALNLDDESKTKPRLPYRAGMIALAIGVGLLLSNHFMVLEFAGLHFPLLVAGLITSCIGVALLLNDWLNRGRINQETD